MIHLPQRKVTWSWTNWTFGPWYRCGRRHHTFGVDAGPLEIVWTRQVRVRRRQRETPVNTAPTYQCRRDQGHPDACPW